MNRKKHIDQFAKLSEYMLGRRPDEFGLVPDNDGYVKIKEFIQAVTEIDGWRHIRKNTINEMMLVHPDPPVEIAETRIRAKDRSNLPASIACDNPPGLLYTCIKQKSHLTVLENGIHPAAHARVICSKDPEIAKTIGKRRSPQPILLTIHTSKMLDQGRTFLTAGDLLYVTDFIPTECFTGPSPAKESPAAKKPEIKPDSMEIYKQQTQAGTFTLSPSPDDKKFKGKRKEKDLSWKNNKKRFRREKKNSWPDQ